MIVIEFKLSSTSINDTSVSVILTADPPSKKLVIKSSPVAAESLASRSISGASFTGFTVIVTVAWAILAPSLTS